MQRQVLTSPEHQHATIVSQLLADRWSVRIIASLLEGSMRFSVLQRSLGISSKTLSKRLKELEQQALIARTLYAQVPLRVEYELTAKGEELLQLLSEFAAWEKKWK